MESVQVKFEKRDKIHRDISMVLIMAMIGFIPLMKQNLSLYLFLAGLAVTGLVNFYLSYRNHQTVGKEKELLKKRALVLIAGLVIFAAVSLI